MDKKSLIEKVGWGFGMCNMNCEHCYNSSSFNVSTPQYSIDELIRAADKICPWIRDINFGTGEFMCNKNALELLRYITDNYPHLDIAITSNGYSILQIDPVELKKRLNNVDISIDFPEEEKHNHFRRHPRAWAWAIEALRILRELGISHTITACITSKTTNEDISGILRLANRFDANVRFNWYRQVGRGSAELRVSADRAWEIIFFLVNKVAFISLDSVFAGPLGLRSHKCPAGGSSMRIHQDMSVTAYPFLKGDKWSAGNILDPAVNMESIFNSLVFKELRDRQVPYCKNCKYFEVCGGGCVTRAFLHNGSVSNPDDFCPVLSNQEKIIPLIRDQITQCDSFDLVHEGYLCTTIMKPFKGEDK